MTRKSDLDIIRRYLQWWDPLSVIDDLVQSGNPLTEYDSYAEEIHQLLAANAGLFKLMAALEDIQLNRMGLDEVNKIKDRKLAEGLIKCYSEFEDLFY